MASCGSGPSISQQHLVAPTTDTVYTWYTPWRSALGVKSARITTKRRCVVGNFQCRPCMQVAAVRGDKPEDPVPLDSQMRAGAGEQCVAATISDTTDSKMLVRYGVAYSVSSGGLGQADVELAVVDDGCGDSLGTTSATLVTMSGTNAYFVITGWVPALTAAVVKAAIIITGLTGNFQCRLAWRAANTSTEAPGAWSDSFDAWHTSNTELCTGELQPGASTDMWVQFAIQYALSSGSSLGSATVSTTIGGRKA